MSGDRWGQLMTCSTLSGQPDGPQRLFNFLNQLEQNEKDAERRKELTQLKTLRDKLQKRKEIFEREINSDSKNPKLLSQINAEAKLKAEVHKQKDFEALIGKFYFESKETRLY